MDRIKLLEELEVQKKRLKQNLGKKFYDNKRLKVIRLLSYAIAILLVLLGIQQLYLQKISQKSLIKESNWLKILKVELVMFLLRFIKKKIGTLIENGNFQLPLPTKTEKREKL